MNAQTDRAHASQEPAVFRQGFRPFFLGAAAWAAVSMLIWIGFLTGGLPAPGISGALDWHVHALLFGYTGAVIGGFLLTAIPNWTGRLPLSGWPLAILFTTWSAGRVISLLPEPVPAALFAAVDLCFPVLLIAAAARELIAGKNWRNLRVLVLVSLFAAANALFHWEIWRNGAANLSIRLGLSAVLLLIMLVGGRIIPSFTRNWLANRGAARLPVPFGRFDIAAIAVSATALLAWIVTPHAFWVGAALALAGLLNCVRIGRWTGGRTLSEPLLAILHFGFAFVPLGFLAMGMSTMAPDSLPASAAIHTWTAGAIGLTTIAIMTRASLGHTGRPLTADGTITVIYLLLFASLAFRILSSYADDGAPLLHGAAGCWIGGFGLFIARFARSFFS
ncbi:NnrS family protein [Nisaea sp.]|uniref:NnrS family protein n=1 Tax=Nisaea sp. TaxID=2024842 RepID=UPI003B51CE70